MSKKIRKIGNMKFGEKKYQEIVSETREELKEINQDILVNWEEYK